MKWTTGGTITVLLLLAAAFNWTYRDVWRRGDSTVGTQVLPTNRGTRATLPNSGSECGPMSLFLICKAAGRTRPIAELRRLSNTTAGGTTMLNLKHAAESLGFRAEARELPFPALVKHLAPPDRYAILHVGSAHFTPAFSSTENSIRVADPERGVQDISESALLGTPYKWGGTALLLTPAEDKGGSF